MSGSPHAMRLAEAAVGRLYHDISGSLGAILNGLELAAGTHGVAEEAMEIAADAARDVASRLRLARAVWNLDAPLHTGDLPELAEGLPNRSRLQLDLAGLEAGSLEPPVARALLAMLIMAAEALHGRGTLVVTGEASDGLAVMFDGLRAEWPEELPALIADPQLCLRDPEPRDIAPRLAVLLAREAGLELSLPLSAGLSAGPPPLLLSAAR